MKKFSLSERKFFVHLRHFKATFSFILVKRFDYDFVSILGWFLQWFEGFWKFI